MRSEICEMNKWGILLLCCLGCVFKATSQVDVNLFRNPPMQARPNTYWEWMNGNISKEGITADLEYMKRANYGAAMIFEAGVGIPRGEVDYNSSQWTECVLHAMKEAERLDMKLFMHNSPGYSGTGGPWITVDNSMKQLVWSEAFVSATGKKVVEKNLLRPVSKMGYYRDAYVLAYPSLDGEGRSFSDRVRRMTLDGKVLDWHLLSDNDLSTQYRLEKGESLLFELDEECMLQSSDIFRGEREKPLDPHDGPRDYSPGLVLEVSVDGKTFVKVGRYDSPALRAMDVLSTLNFVPCKVRYLRITSDRGTNLAEVDFHASPRLVNYPAKINCVNARVSLEDNVQEVRPDGVIRSSEVTDITQYVDGQGRLRWKAPAGKWTVVRIGYTTTGEVVAAAPDAGRGLDCDKLSKKGIDQHFDKFMSPLLEKLKPWCGSTLEALVVDSWESGKQNWTEELPAYFRQKRGYDLMPYLLAVTGRIVDGVECTERFLWDFRRTHTDMFLENYVERLKERAARYNLKFAGEAYGDGNFESLELAARQDYPMSEFWTHYIYGNISTTMLASSVAHVWGLPIVQCECYTGTPFNSKFTEHPYGMKAMGDYIMTAGVNRFVYHATTHQPYVGSRKGVMMTMGPFGTHLDRTSTWTGPFGALNLYNARCAYVLQLGHYVADVLYLKDEAISTGVDNYNAVVPATPYGYRWDIISVEGLLQRVSADAGRIVLPDGMTYRMLVVPSLRRTAPETLRRLKELVEQGVTLLVCGTKPAGYLGLDKQKDGEVRRLADELWRNQSLGKGKVYVNSSIPEVLKRMGIQPDFSFRSVNRDALIHFIHRRTGNEDVYFVTNQRRRCERLTVTCRIDGKVPYLWNAETGKTDLPVEYETGNGQTKLNLELPESGSVFIVFKSDMPVGEKEIEEVSPVPTVVYTRKGGMQTYSGSWDLASTFTLSCWCKPETFAARGRGFVLFPTKGNGTRAKVGFSMGQNGVKVYENAGALRMVLEAQIPIEGWTCVTLVYNEGIPSLYLNGKMVAVGKKSAYVQCVPSIDEPMVEEQLNAVFEGDNTPLKVFDYAFTSEDAVREWAKGLPPVNVGGTVIKDLSYDWTVQFPQWSRAPEQICLPRLVSLHKHGDFNVRHFSGTAVYMKRFYVSDKEYVGLKGKQVWLNLGRVENMAEVSLNGSDTCLLWKAPYELKVTGHIQIGENLLVVKVTNLYPNRIIGDEYLLERYDYDEYGRIRRLPSWYRNNDTEKSPERVLFLPWKYYKKTDPLLEAGLLGDVSLVVK